MEKVKLIECPRDAMQGIIPFIPTEEKVSYLNLLLKVGFDILDAGSFVSHKAIPQMKDTAEVLDKIDHENSKTKLSVIIANHRGAKDAVQFDQVDFLGYPFSISETFQIRNTNTTIAESIDRVKEIRDVTLGADKEMIMYISMGFGNPYGDPWNADICKKWIATLYDLDVRIFALSDTVGVSNPDNISYIFSHLIKEFPNCEFGAHLHTTPDSWYEKVEAAFNSGCRRFDGALKGHGGCPMARDELTGNMATENIIDYFDKRDVKTIIDDKALRSALNYSLNIFH